MSIDTRARNFLGDGGQVVAPAEVIDGMVCPVDVVLVEDTLCVIRGDRDSGSSSA